MELINLFAYLIKLKKLDVIELRYLPEPVSKDLEVFLKKKYIILPQKITHNMYLEWLEKLNSDGFYKIINCHKFSLPRIPNLFNLCQK